MSPLELQELKKQLDTYLAAGQIEPAKSPFGAGVLFAPKPDGSKRMCIDYRNLNKITVKDKYPIPRIDEILDEFKGAAYFTKIDLQQGYHQIRVKPDHVGRTAFQTPFGSFQFRVMPFGLCNAPSTFQRTMNNLLQDCRSFARVYIDDIVIYSRTLEEHVEHVRKVLEKLRQEKFYARRKKCSFAQQEIEFCGFLVNREGIFTHPEKIKHVKEWPMPKNVKDVRSFIGLAGFYQRFVPNFANLAGPLTALFKKNVSFKWTHVEQTALDKLKAGLIAHTQLAYPDFSRQFVLHMDASKTAVGATLSQPDDNGDLRLVTCVSRKLNDAERNYPTHEREMLALVHALKKWKHYLLGSHVTVYTDNTTLKYWRTAQNLSERQSRWLAYIQMFDIEIHHIKGVENTAADALSRLECRTNVEVVDDEEDERDSWKDAYLKDQVLKEKYFTNTGAVADPSVWHHGRIWKSDRIVVPKSKWREVVTQQHSDVLHGHWGARKTFDSVARRYVFPAMKWYISEFVKICPTCQKVKADRRGIQGELQPLPVPTRKWQSISIDWVVGMPSVTRRDMT
ncbi:MAG: reverse transcriptase domain-containing protein, partial [Mycobacterium sp.]